jgi:hypothetical protein
MKRWWRRFGSRPKFPPGAVRMQLAECEDRLPLAPYAKWTLYLCGRLEYGSLGTSRRLRGLCHRCRLNACFSCRSWRSIWLKGRSAVIIIVELLYMKCNTWSPAPDSPSIRGVQYVHRCREIAPRFVSSFWSKVRSEFSTLDGRRLSACGGPITWHLGLGVGKKFTLQSTSPCPTRKIEYEGCHRHDQIGLLPHKAQMYSCA